METKLNVIDKYQGLSCEELREVYVNEMNKDIVLCLNLTGEWNIGCIIRTASLFQMGKVVIVGAKYYDKRTTVGMHHYIPIEKINSTPESNPHVKQLDLEKVKQILEEYKKTHQVIFVEHGGFNSREIHQHVKGDIPVLFVLVDVNNVEKFTNEYLHEMRNQIDQEIRKREIKTKNQHIKNFITALSPHSKQIRENISVLEKVSFDCDEKRLIIRFEGAPYRVFLIPYYDIFKPWFHSDTEVQFNSEDLLLFKILHRIKLQDGDNILNDIFKYLKNNMCLFLENIETSLVNKYCLYCGEKADIINTLHPHKCIKCILSNRSQNQYGINSTNLYH